MPYQTLEDETFRILCTLYPKANHLTFDVQRQRDMRTMIEQKNPSLIISRQHIPRYVSIPNLVISSSLLYSRFSRWFRSNVYTLRHNPQTCAYKQYILPPLLLSSSKPESNSYLVSIGPFHSSSNHHLALDSYALLPKKIRTKYTLIFCGTKDSQEEIDRLQLHGYGLGIQIVHDRKKISSLISQAQIVFRLGDSTQKNLSVDREILEYQRPTIHFAHTARTSLYQALYRVEEKTPVALKALILSIIKTPSSPSNLFEPTKVKEQYFSLIRTLQTR